MLHIWHEPQFNDKEGFICIIRVLAVNNWIKKYFVLLKQVGLLKACYFVGKQGYLTQAAKIIYVICSLIEIKEP